MVKHYLFFILEIWPEQKLPEIILLIYVSILNLLLIIIMLKKSVCKICRIDVILVFVIHSNLLRVLRLKVLRGGIQLIHLIILLKSIILFGEDFFFLILKIINFWIQLYILGILKRGIIYGLKFSILKYTFIKRYLSFRLSALIILFLCTFI